MNKRLDIFISGTVSDLKEERQLVSELIIRTGNFPVFQETFNNGYQEITKVIDKNLKSSDVYLLFLGGKYGSIEPKSGLSYTELEFDLAERLKKKIIVMILTDEYILAINKNLCDIEVNDHRYQNFKNKVINNGKFVNFVSNQTEIGLVIYNSLSNILCSA